MSRRVNLISVSGGKDSTAMILNAIERGVEFQSVFADTGNEHPDVYEYLDYLRDALQIEIQVAKADFTKQISKKAEFVKKHWAKHGVPSELVSAALEALKPTGNPFLDMCIWKGRFPSAKGRFCTEELKTIPVTEQVVLPIIRSGRGVRSWQGVRRQESTKRATYDAHKLIDYGVWVYRPILDWTHEEVFAIHRKHGIKANPLYMKGMGRVGCMPCIMCRKSELAEIARRFPEEIARLREWERIVSAASKRGCSTFFNVSDFMRDKDNIHHLTHGIDAATLWSKTLHGGSQFGLFEEHEEIPSCSSHYGLCELPDELSA